MPCLLIHVTGDRIGDALLKWPVILALKRALPQHRMTWIAGRRSSVFNGPLKPLAHGVIDEVKEACDVGVSWSEWFRPQIRDRYDIVLATGHNLGTALLLKRIPHDVFICPALGFALSDRRPDKGQMFPESAFEQFKLLGSLAAGTDLTVEPEIELPVSEKQWARRLLPDGPVYIGFAPGASTVRKRWPFERFINVAKAQIDKGRVPVFFLGPDEPDLKAAIEQQIDPVIIPEIDEHGARRGGPLLSIALARLMTVSFANDSGAGHILAAGGRPLVSLFGHTDERKFRPPYGTRVVLRARDFGGTEMSRIPESNAIRAIDEAVERWGLT